VWTKLCARYWICMLTELFILQIQCMYVDRYTKHNANLKQCPVHCRFRCCFSVHLRMLFHAQKLYTKQCWNSNVLRYLVFDTYTGCFIMYSGITKIYYRKTVRHIFTTPVQIEGTSQNFFPTKLFFIIVHISAARRCECM
jgi:hypothetical protein